MTEFLHRVLDDPWGRLGICLMLIGAAIKFVLAVGLLVGAW